MSYTIGVVGLGQFAPSFIPLFQAHPLVDHVAVCDHVPERLNAVAARFGVSETYASFEEMCRSDVDAIAIFTQRWLHGPMTVRALRHGKHVYSSVPMGVSVDEIDEILATVTETGLTYMSGETSYYYPAVVFCRERWRAGDFGDFVYGEGEYLHDMSHGFYDAFRFSGGDDWRSTASFPPMHYPTHSVSAVLSVTGDRMASVSCTGIPDRSDDGVFDRGVSAWDNDFSNESALFETASGGAVRINEFRRIGVANVEPSVRVSLFGTHGSFEQQSGTASWATRDHIEDVTASLRPHLARLRGTDVITPIDEEDNEMETVPWELRYGFRSGYAAVHQRDRLPREFDGRPNGHEGSHQFLVDDFLTAVDTRNRPPVDAWTAARYAVPGLVAHQSARRDGERMAVPDFGDPEGEQS